LAEVKGSARVELINGELHLAEVHRYEAQGIGKKEIEIKRLLDRDTNMTFAICLDNEGYEASLELRKIYQVLPPETNDLKDYVRVVDESGEDYLYQKKGFELI